jgi:hypothetical protein
MKIAKPLRMLLLAHIITDPEVAESIAARRAVPFCEELGFHSVVFEGDSLNAVNALNSHTPCWRLGLAAALWKIQGTGFFSFILGQCSM